MIKGSMPFEIALILNTSQTAGVSSVEASSATIIWIETDDCAKIESSVSRSIPARLNVGIMMESFTYMPNMRNGLFLLKSTTG